ncbi:MAG: hypothetical protein H0V82_00230 [Candidatus Protochlamydia sp.]|nr:hypothetical protein [Candidatus Protochlamydia sp.]
MKIDFAEINSTCWDYFNYARQQTGELITQGNKYGVKIKQITIDCFQNPTYAKGGVVLANIGISFIAYKTVFVVDVLFDRIGLKDDRLSERMITAKCLFLGAVFVATFIGLNVNLSRALAPNMSIKMHSGLASATLFGLAILFPTMT